MKALRITAITFLGIVDTSDAEFLDCYTFVGNSSGTGNHVDLLTLMIVKAEEKGVIEKTLEEAYEETGTFPLEYFTVTPLSPSKDSYDPYARFMDEMTIPEDMENCYLISYCNSAPFADNIMGH